MFHYFRDVVVEPPTVQGACILGEKFVSVTGPGGSFVRNSVTVDGGAVVPAENLNDLPMALFGGEKVFYKFVITNCGTEPCTTSVSTTVPIRGRWTMTASSWAGPMAAVSRIRV